MDQHSARKRKYKQSKRVVEDIAAIRQRKKDDTTEQRKAKREQVLNAKRFRLHSRCEEKDEVTEEQVKEAVGRLSESGSDKKDDLQLLSRGFSQGTLYIDAFFSVENSLSRLVGILTGGDAELQLQVVWCLTNIAAGTNEQALSVAKAAAPYLITYLSSSNPRLQDQCAWALGNLAGDSLDCREILKAQGILTPLVKLLHHDHNEPSKVLLSAAFAISNMIRECADSARELVEGGVIPMLLPLLETISSKLDLVAEVGWVLTYLSACGSYASQIDSSGVLARVVQLLVWLAEDEVNNGMVVTPLMRSLGNICGGDDLFSKRACENADLLPALGQYLQSTHRHVIKETLWVLSNMTAEEGVCRSVTFSNIIPSVEKYLTSTYDIKLEAGYLICNLACHGADFCSELIKKGALKEMIQLLKSHDAEVIHLGLAFSEMALRMTVDGRKNFEDEGGVSLLEGLEYNSNETIRSEAQSLLDTYFLLENEDEPEAIEEN